MSLQTAAGSVPTQRKIVVAGFGAAGAAAALSAAKAGADVTVIDRAPAADRGGNTRQSLFFLAMNSTTELNDEMKMRLPGNASNPWLSTDGKVEQIGKHWGFDPNFVQRWIDDTVPVVSWLQDEGFTFTFRECDLLDDGYAPGLVPDCGGDGLLDAIEKSCRSLGVTFHYETSLVDINVDESDRVLGVTVEKDGIRQQWSCDAVIMATGGFHGNLEMMTRYLGPNARYAHALSRQAWYNTGVGHTLAMRFGGVIKGDVADWHGLTMDERADGRREFVGGMELGILVNRNGKRFHDEATGEPAEKAVRDQPGGVGYFIADSSVRRFPFFDRRFHTPHPAIESDTIEGLADKIGIPSREFSRTVRSYNKACAETPYPDEITDELLAVPKSRGAKPLIEAPFLAWPLRAGICFSLGGISTDEDGRILTENGHAVESIYAVGDLGGGYYNGYANYTASIKALVFGRRAGLRAAGGPI